MVGSKCRDIKNREVSNVNAPYKKVFDLIQIVTVILTNQDYSQSQEWNHSFLI